MNLKNNKIKQLESNNVIFILRHCNTEKNQNIIPSEYDQKLKILYKIIKKVIKKYPSLEIKFYTSPIKRCIDTCNLITEYLTSKKLIKCKIIIDDDLKRWDKGNEKRENSYERAFEYAKKFSKIQNEMNFYITHSSMIPRLTYGFIKNSMTFKIYKKKYMEEKLKHNSIAIIKNNELKKYNF